MDAALIMKRIRRIERRLARLEQVTLGRTTPSPSADPGPAPADAPLATPAASSEPRHTPLDAPSAGPAVVVRRARERKPIEWERFFGMAVLGRIGVGAVLLAAGYFAQLAYRELPDALRVLSIYALAAAFVGVGAFLRERVHRRYVGLLWGGGAAAAYLAGVVARLRYELVSAPAALLLLVLASALGHVLARRLKHQALASTALAGAFAAPLLIGATSENRTFLLAYLGMLYLWAAWMQRAWTWWSARIVALGGVAIVGGLWLLQHGALDASTYWHVSAYVLVLILPEVARALRGDRLHARVEGALVAFVAAATTLMLVLTFHRAAPHMPGRHVVLPAFGVGAGAFWLGVASALAHAGGGRLNRTVFRGLAHVGGIALVSALWGISTCGPSWFGIAEAADAEVVGALLLAAAAVGLVLHQRRVGAGELAATIGAGLLAGMAMDQGAPAYALWLGGLGGATALALMVLCRSPSVRGFASWIGLVALWMGLERATHHGEAWILLPFATCAAYIVAFQVIARRRQDRALVDGGLGMLALLAVLWSALGFLGTYADVSLPILDAMTLGGLAIVAAAFAGAALVRRWRPAGTDRRSAVWAALAMVVLVVIGHRETVSAVASLPSAARDALHVTYLCVAAVVFAAVARRRGAEGVGWLAAALLGIAVLKALAGTTDAPDGAWPCLALLAPTAATGVLAFALAPKRAGIGLYAMATGAVLVLGWVGYTLESRLPAEPALLNLRMGTGLALLGLGLALGAGYRRRTGSAQAPLLLLAWVLALAWLVGLFELLDLVEPLAGAWPRVLVSVYTTVFAAGLLALGFARGDRRLRYPALAGFGAVVLKVGLHDLGGTPLPLRILVTGVLGLVLLGAAFAYARTARADDDQDPEVRGGGTQDAPL